MGTLQISFENETELLFKYIPKVSFKTIVSLPSFTLLKFIKDVANCT